MDPREILEFVTREKDSLLKVKLRFRMSVPTSEKYLI